MNTEREIKRLAKEITPHYAFGTIYQLNKVTGRMRSRHQMPACLHLQTTTGSVDFNSSLYYMREHGTQRVQVGFADAVKLDQDPELTIPVVDKLVSMCSDLVKKMNDSELWDRIESFSYEVLYDTQDANLVFVLATFDAREKDGKCID